MLNMAYTQFSFLLFLCFCLPSFSSSIPHPCRKDQSAALLKFKRTLSVDPSASEDCDEYGKERYPKTSSWNMSRDCCSWDGVICDEMTGHVIDLDLGCSQLVGTIDSNSSLFQLCHLQRLNLSYNGFYGSHISPKFGRFSSLKHLDLSNSSFTGQIPSEISHLSKLQSLFLSHWGRTLILGRDNFEMVILNLTQLRELDLTFINISSAIPQNFSSHLTTLRLQRTGLYGIIPESIFHLPNLETLDLSYNDQLSGSFPKTKWNSSASLMKLDLSFITFSGNLPEYLSNFTRIEDLNLKRNFLNGSIPSSMLSLPSLRKVVLSGNYFSGQLEDFKSNSLVWIDLRNNQLQGQVPKSIQNLVNLTTLDLSFNNFSGNVDISLFSNLKHLWYLSLSYNNISLINEKEVEFTLPGSLERLELAACEVKKMEFLRSAKHLEELDLSNNKLQGRVPDWAWSNWMFSLKSLNLSHNMLTSIDSIPLQSVEIIDLRSNLLQGLLPIPGNSTRLFFISQNIVIGEIPLSICNLRLLQVLDLARNNLTGEIPECLGDIIHLEVLDMHRNNLSGSLPATFITESSLRSFNLHDNKLKGKIPQSLANCKELQVLDLGDNQLNDTFPMWLGALPNLQVLILRSNKLHGSIRTSRIGNMFPKLRIIDLSYNAFSGILPVSLFQHLKAMRTIDQTKKLPAYLGDKYYQDSITIATKGLKLELVRILTIYTTIDLSSNKFEGHIPHIMGDFIALRVLNLSHNALEGHIPPSLGSLSVVESFDLSFNQLSGEIPQQLASLTSLAFLNLSYNHLRGCIPQGAQFSTFEKYSYGGNDGLRGFPVSKGCGNGVSETNYTESAVDDEESNSEFWSDFWKAALMGYGSGLCIGLSIIYFMISTGNPKWLARIIEVLEYMIMVRQRKKQGRKGNYRRRNNHF
ncbi:hypothetical protein BC332_31031 [Capsicum chinense]|nr:hypothetical protein BC332_31031 [Capsicum chinense]